MSLREQLIRLGTTQPHLRKHLRILVGSLDKMAASVVEYTPNVPGEWS